MSKKIKILVLSHISDLTGGAEMSMLDTFDYWNAHYDIEPEFVMRQPAKALAGALQERGWKYYVLDYTFWSDGVPPIKAQDIFKAATVNAQAVFDIEEIIKTSKPDLVMTNSIVSPWAAIAAHFQKVPHAWFVREYGDLDHGRTFEIGREATFNDVDILSDLVITNSKTLAEHVRQYVDAKKVTTLYTPFKVNLMREKLQESAPSPFTSKDSLKLVMTGTLAPSKGQGEAVEAVGLLNDQGYDVEICLIGGNPAPGYMEQMESTIKEHNISKKVHFVGHQANPFAYIALADVGVMASRKEAFGRVTFEYLAAGKPVVGANAGATPELVKDGHSGYLYEQGDSNSLAKALTNYAKDKSLIEKHGVNAKKSTDTMMSGDFGADALFEKIKVIATKGYDSQKEFLNFSHRWLEYVLIAERSINESKTMSLKGLVKLRLRQKAKGIYHKARTAKSRILGK